MLLPPPPSPAERVTYQVCVREYVKRLEQQQSPASWWFRFFASFHGEKRALDTVDENNLKYTRPAGYEELPPPSGRCSSMGIW
jgi:hypothetical protein